MKATRLLRIENVTNPAGDIRSGERRWDSSPIRQMNLTCSVRDRSQDSHLDHAVDDQLHGNRRDKEAEDLLRDRHAVLV